MLADYICRGRANRRPGFVALSFLKIGETMFAAYRKLTRPVSSSIVLLMLIGYALMGCMMVEQDRTITAQRDLIHKLFQDTVRLSVAQLNQAKLQHERQR
jgi:hypothetical protein